MSSFMPRRACWTRGSPRVDAPLVLLGMSAPPAAHRVFTPRQSVLAPPRIGSSVLQRDALTRSQSGGGAALKVHRDPQLRAPLYPGVDTGRKRGECVFLDNAIIRPPRDADDGAGWPGPSGRQSPTRRVPGHSLANR